MATGNPNRALPAALMVLGIGLITTLAAWQSAHTAAEASARQRFEKLEGEGDTGEDAREQRVSQRREPPPRAREFRLKHRASPVAFGRRLEPGVRFSVWPNEHHEAPLVVRDAHV